MLSFLRPLGRGGPAERGGILAEVDRHAVETRADPDELAGRAQLVELSGLVPGDATREHLRLPERDRERQRLQRHERFPQARAAVDSVPAREESPERRLLRGLDLLAQRGQGSPAEAPEDVRVAPLALAASRPELAADDPLLALELPQQRLDVDAEVLVRLGGRERPTALREASDKALQRIIPALEERLRQTARRHRAESVAVTARVLGGDEAVLAGDTHGDRPALGEQRVRKRSVEISRPKVAAPPQDVVQLVRIARRASQLSLDLLERTRVDEVAQLLLPEELAEQVAVERERLCPSLGRRRVVLVHVVRHVVEEKRGRVRRGRGGLDVDEVELARLEPGQQPLQRGQVEDVLKAFAVGLEHNRERAVALGDLKQALGLQPLLPERGSLAGPAPRDQERARSVLPETRAEERAPAELGHDELLDLVRVDDQLLGGRRGVCVRQVDGDAVVRPERLRLEPE